MDRSRSLKTLLLAALGFTTACSAPAAGSQEDMAADPLMQRYVAWQDANALPAIRLEEAGVPGERKDGSRIGGPVWLPQGEAWPTGTDGKPLSFVAQIDFSAMPPLPDYPTSGVLQFFIGRDDYYGANFEKPEAGNFKVIFRESMDGAGRFETGPVGEAKYDDYSPLFAETITRGVALKAATKPEAHKPSLDSWLFNRDLGDAFEDPSTHPVYDAIADQSRDWGYGVYIGGHPEFTQSDWRETPEYNDVDRVLLQLWTQDDHLMWGDSGQGQFTIRREDLLKKDFSKVFYQWDCY